MKSLRIIKKMLAVAALIVSPALLQATAPPDQVATVVVHGFDPDGASGTGVVGQDVASDYIAEMAGVIGLPLSTTAPLAQNQVAHATYYGNIYPDYYTQQDRDEVDAAGLGVPRYALIMAKYAEHVMQRSGAKQVNLLAVSFGGLISRYMIEKDVEGLASSGKIARWISIEGVVAGNWAATYGGEQFEDYLTDYYDAELVDLQHMRYDWVQANLNNPRTSSSSPFFGQFPVHFWQAANDDLNNKALTIASREANDGVVLIEDAVFQDLPMGSRYLSLMPTVSAINATHEGTKSNLGIRAGIAAQLFGRKRITITLTQARVLTEFDGSLRQNGEYVFGARVFSPKAQEVYGITSNINVRRANNNSIDYLTLPVNQTVSPNLIWFDDMILPGETELHVETLTDEVDADIIYNILEAAGTEVYEPMGNTTVTVSTLVSGTYDIATTDWIGRISVAITEYPAFDDESSVSDWNLY